MGGPQMAAADIDLKVDSTELGVVGVIEVLKHIFTFVAIFFRLVRAAKQERPDEVVLIDYPGFNLLFALMMYANRIPVVWYVCPHLWVWGKWRLPVLAKICTKMLVIFPFEEEVFAPTRLRATFVGHPLVDIVEERRDPEIQRSPEEFLLLPGSRTMEINFLLRPMLDTISQLAERHPELKFHLSAPREKIARLCDEIYGEYRRKHPDVPTVNISCADTPYWQQRAGTGLAASGTVTVESAIAGLPLVVGYKLNWVTILLASLVVRLYRGYFTMVNIIANRTVIPGNMGVEFAPLDNIGKVRSRGMDLSAKVQHAFSPDCWFILNGTLTYSKAVYKDLEEAVDKPAWQLSNGYEISQQIGYIAEGLFRDQAEIDNAPSQPWSQPGDIRYRDVNGDGKIDVNDAVHIGFPETPRLVYGFSGFLNYKNWEFNFAFQGSGKRGFFINAESISPFDGSRAMLKAIYDSHWTEDNMSNKPFWPRLSVDNIITYNVPEDWDSSMTSLRKSTYFMRECSFLRCTSLELAYNLSENLRNKLRMQNVKFFLRANNPFIISDFKLWDVELGDNGFNYPIQKTYAIGVNISF